MTSLSTHSTLSSQTTLVPPQQQPSSQSSTTTSTFPFPKTYNFPPFFTLQPTALTRAAQLNKWSSLVQSYCRHHRIYRLSVIEAASWPLFSNANLKKRLAEGDIRVVIDYMASPEGEGRAEWIDSSGAGSSAGKTKASAWVWWRKPEEWGELIAGWVEETGQRGTVLTLFEIVEGEGSEKCEFHGMEMEVLRKSLAGLVKKGKAQIFGQEDQQGVKFF